MPDLRERCAKLVESLGLSPGEHITEAEPLLGGVASDILRIKIGNTYYCAKFALAQLRVAAEWSAPVHRNKAEYEWLAFVGNAFPDAVPELYGHSATENGFIMEFVAGDDVLLWKTELLAGRVNPEHTLAVARIMSSIHSSSAKASFDDQRFENQDDFYSLRLEPYFVELGRKYPELEAQINTLVDGHKSARIALVHGDLSPKNILFKSGQPILLDAECACIGDPAFDVGFCLNHLLLKAVHLPDVSEVLLEGVKRFWETYQANLDWEPVQQMERRLLKNLPFLMLARVDGKSPLEYLQLEERDRIRQLSLSLIKQPEASLSGLCSRIGAIIQ